MPSVDPDSIDASMYPTLPPGPPPPGRAVDSPDRRGPSHSQYGYVPSGYGGPPSGPPPSSYYPMAPPPQVSEKSGSQFYGHFPPQQHHPPQQSYPGYGNPTPGPYMTYGYNGAPWMPYEGGGGPPGFYPSQRMQTNDKVQSISRSSASGANYSTNDTASSADQRKEILASSSSLSENQYHQVPNLKHMHTAEELDRLKAAAVVELGLSEVKPIQSDYHFFVHDNKYKLLPLAIAEVDRKLEGKSAEFIRKHRTFLIHSNLNCRVMKSWEDLPRTEREEYFKKEEDDRQRFMDEDEVVSRHCFTLTARIRSPSKSNNLQSGEVDDDANDDNGGQYEYDNNDGDREVCDNTDDHRNDRTKGETPVEGKRLSDDATKKEESPAKKNKADTDTFLPEEHHVDGEIERKNE